MLLYKTMLKLFITSKATRDAFAPMFKGERKEERRDLSKEIDHVLFNDPYTIVFWKDRTKTVVKCQEGDKYSKEIGLSMCIIKKLSGNWGGYNEVFRKFCPEEEEVEVEGE